MELLSIESATYTQFPEAMNLVLTADIDDGKGPQSLPYTWIAGDPFGLGPQVDAWMAENSMPVAPYARPPEPLPVDPEVAQAASIAIIKDELAKLKALGIAI